MCTDPKTVPEWLNLFSGSVATASWQLSGEAEAREASHSITGIKVRGNSCHERSSYFKKDW
jgi:hypothetical protein